MKSWLSAVVKLTAGFGLAAVPLQADFLFVTNGGGISAYQIVAPKGALIPVVGFPFPAPATVAALAVGATGKFLYAACDAGGFTSVVTYSIGSNGTLQQVGLPAIAPGIPFSIVADPKNRFVYIASGGRPIDEYHILPDGTLAYIGAAVAGANPSNPTALAMDPAGKYVFAADPWYYAVYSYNVLANGDLSLSGEGFARQPLFNTGLAVNPTGAFVYVVDSFLPFDSPGFSVLGFQSGAFGSVSPVDFDVHYLTTDPTGKYVYMAGSNKVSAFGVQSDGSLTLLGETPSTGLSTLAADSTGRFVYGPNGQAVEAFRISPTGTLNIISGSPFPVGSGATALAVTAVRTPGIYSNLIGDKDDFHSGDIADFAPQSDQVVNLEAALQARGQHAGADLDNMDFDRPVGLTHYLSLPLNALTTSAKLHFRAKGTANEVNLDGIFYNETVVPPGASDPLLPVILFRDLIGHEPKYGEIIDVTIDLGKVPVHTKWPPAAYPEEYRSLLPSMLGINQKLDLVFDDDNAVDFSELTLTYVTDAAPPGDLNGDGRIDSNDVNMIMSVLNTPAWGTKDPRDLDHDGKITVLDARKLATLCTKPGCAVQ